MTKHLPVTLTATVSGILFLPAAAAASRQSPEINWFILTFGLAGGLALFLAGLEQLSEGLKKAAGQTLKLMLDKMTGNRVMGAITGATVTGILNSSSITTVLVVGFVTAGVMTLSQSVGVIMGANIGSTVTAQILAFNISKYALLPIAVGFFLIFINKSDRLKYCGMMLMGLGLVFFGMSIMSESMAPLRSYPPFLEVLKKMANPALGIMTGALFTGLVQSSAATVGIAIALASEGFLSLEAGIALALGANVGTCITALLAAIGKPVEAIRAAVVHIVFNIAGVLLWVSFVPFLADITVWLSPSSPNLQGVARMAAEVPRQVANANTLFNVVNTLLFLPFTAVFAWLARKLVPDRPPTAGIIEPIFLDDAVINVPSIALDRVRKELARSAEIIQEMLTTSINAMKTSNPGLLRTIKREDDKVDRLEEACISYLSRIRQNQLTENEIRQHQTLLVATVALENLGDVIEIQLVELGEQEIGINYTKSDQTSRLTDGLYLCVQHALDLVCLAIRENSVEAAEELLDIEPHIKQLRRDLMIRKSERLGSDNQDAILVARIEISVASKLMRMYNLMKNIASEIISEHE